MEKKNLAIIILAIVLAASGVGNVILGVMSGLIEVTAPPSETVIYGYGSNPAALDPIDTWDVPSHVIQHQVTQSLIEYDLSTHPDYQLKMVLAESYEWESLTRCTFTLRKDVYFHDGEIMTAEAVKWNFERVQYFINTTGTLPANATSWESFPGSLFFFTDGTPIFDSFEADDNVDPFSFTIVLTAPFAALLDLLAFGATNILSPASTPFYRYLDLADDILVGTGPYEYKHFILDLEVRLERFEDYWGPQPYFAEAVIRIIKDDTTRMIAGLAGLFDYVGGVPKTYIDTYKADSDFIVTDVGEDLCYFYLEIYCGPADTDGTLLGDPQFQKNNASLRRALALAINYSYIYTEIQSGYAVEGTPAVPRAMPGHNASVVQASDSKFTWEGNIAKARDIIKTMWPMAASWDSTYGGANEADWTGNTFKTLEMNRHLGSTTSLRINQLITSNFDLIGIATDETIRDWGPYLDTGENTPWEMDIGYIGWCPDYLNPFNMIDPLFNLASGSCFSRINDTSTGGLTDMMTTAGAETNRTIQLDIYKDIQSYIYDIERAVTPASHTHISGWVYLVQQTHKASLLGVQYNVMTMVEIANWYRE